MDSYNGGLPLNERDLFLAARAIGDPEARRAFLEHACADDRERYRQLEALLQAEQQAGSFLSDPPVLQLVQPVPGLADYLQPATRSDSLGRLGHYEVLQVIGQGTFGIVVRAVDEVLNREVALKILLPRLAGTAPSRQRFLNEARAVAALAHDHIVTIHAIEESPLPYLILEYVSGENLQQLLDRQGPLSIDLVGSIALQIARGLAAAHERGLIHCDIKPANVLVQTQPDGRVRVKIADFGLARAANEARHDLGRLILGTPLYMAPEQITGGQAVDHRADLFSLGSLLYVMCTGHPPFPGKTVAEVLQRVAQESARPVRDLSPAVPVWLASLIDRLHARNPDDRLSSAQEVVALLEANPLSRPQRSRRVWVALALLGCLLVTAGVGLFAWPSGAIHSEIPSPLLAEDPPAAPERIRDTDQRAALHVLSLGGRVQINGTQRFLTRATDLPNEPFRLTGIELRANPNVNAVGLANCRGCVHLTTLELTETPVGDVGLSHFRESKRLRILGLGSTAVTDAGLATFADCKELTVINLNYNRAITDAGVAHFQGCKNLKQVILGETKVTDIGLAYFADCEHLTGLEISRTQVTDAGLLLFARCTKLTGVNAGSTRVTAAGVEALEKALPRCKILPRSSQLPR